MISRHHTKHASQNAFYKPQKTAKTAKHQQTEKQAKRGTISYSTPTHKLIIN